MSRLFQHDRRIAINLARGTFASWHDRLIAGAMLVAALAMVRSALAAQPWTIAAWAGLGAGAVVGLGAGRLVAARLRFHGTDGALAAEALRSAGRRRYLLGWHATGLAATAGLSLIARPSILAVVLPGYLIGALAGHLLEGLTLSQAGIGGVTSGRAIRAWSQRPIAGIFAAALLMPPLALAPQTLRENARGAVAGTMTLLLLLPLTRIDHRVVPFMRIAGHGPWRIVGAHARAALLFTGLAVPICWFGFDAVVAGTVTAVCAGALLLFAIRLLSYQLYDKRFADLAFSLVTGLLVLTAFALPPALPVIAAAVLWELQRRARARIWLLA